jgi:hypothetical protein
MWSQDQITVEIALIDDDTILVEIGTPVGLVTILGIITVVDRVLHCDGAHIEGPGPGSLGRAGLNDIGAKLLAETDVDEIVIQGGSRATGRNPGRPPWLIRFPHP